MTDANSPAANTLAARLGETLVVGFGGMGAGLAAGLLDIEGFEAGQLTICDRSAVKVDPFAAAHGTHASADAAATLAAQCFDTVVLAVRPGDAPGLARALAAVEVLGKPLLISILTGVTNTRLLELFGERFRVVRVMPNTPLAVGEGMTLVSGDAPGGADAIALATDLFSAIGAAIVVPEEQFDAGMAISGCGPAYFELIVDALARAGVRHGLSRKVSDMLAIHTMLGTAKLLAVTGKHPQAAMDEVCTPGGTTIAAVETMEALGLRTALAEGVSAAVDRAKGVA